MATTQDKDEKESPKKKGGKGMDDLKKEVPIVSIASISLECECSGEVNLLTFTNTQEILIVVRKKKQL